MKAWFHSLWQHIKQHLVTILIVAIILVLAIALIIIGYRFNWTGFNGNTKSGKTLWDWMQLLFIPVVLAVAGFWFNHRERKAAELRTEAEREIEQQRAKADREISFDNQREAALKEYIDKMSELLLHENLRKSKPEDEVRKIARVLTLTVLPRLYAGRKRSVLQFLYESGLIEKGKRIVDLSGADLMGADLIRAALCRANLSDANLSEANLSDCNLEDVNLAGSVLIKTNLSKSTLNRANLVGTGLCHSNLSEAFLIHADLSTADLIEADLSRTYLSKANLSGTNLDGADLIGAVLKGSFGITIEELEKVAKSLKGATMPDGSIHP